LVIYHKPYNTTGSNVVIYHKLYITTGSNVVLYHKQYITFRFKRGYISLTIY